MCGIAGVVSFAGAPIEEAQAAPDGGALAHRGPDAGRACGSTRAGLFGRPRAPAPFHHRPLARGRPAHRQRGRHHPGHAERRDLQLRRAARAPRRDAIRSARTGTPRPSLHGYEDEGDGIASAGRRCSRSRSWDARRRRLPAGARDPFGKKPLYYWTDGRELLSRFRDQGSARGGGAPAAFDPSGLPEYLRVRLRADPAHALPRREAAAARIHAGRWTRNGCAAAAPTGTCASRTRATRGASRWRRPAAGVRERLDAARPQAPDARTSPRASCSRAASTPAAVAGLVTACASGDARPHVHARLRGPRVLRRARAHAARMARHAGRRSTTGGRCVRPRRVAAGDAAATTTTSRSATRPRCPPTWWRARRAST